MSECERVRMCAWEASNRPKSGRKAGRALDAICRGSSGGPYPRARDAWVGAAGVASASEACEGCGQRVRVCVRACVGVGVGGRARLAPSMSAQVVALAHPCRCSPRTRLWALYIPRSTPTYLPVLPPLLPPPPPLLRPSFSTNSSTPATATATATTATTTITALTSWLPSMSPRSL